MTLNAHIVMPQIKARRPFQPPYRSVRLGFAPPARRTGATFAWGGLGLPLAIALSTLLWATIAAFL